MSTSIGVMNKSRASSRASDRNDVLISSSRECNKFDNHPVNSVSVKCPIMHSPVCASAISTCLLIVKMLLRLRIKEDHECKLKDVGPSP